MPVCVYCGERITYEYPCCTFCGRQIPELMGRELMERNKIKITLRA